VKLDAKQAQRAYEEAGMPAFSGNIFQEMMIDGLKNEYVKSKEEHKECLSLSKNGAIQKDLIKYFYSRNDAKLKAIKQLLAKWRQEAQLSTRLDTLETFDKLRYSHIKDHKRHRMRSLYSYDVRDHEDFRHLFKVEEKIKEFKLKRAHEHTKTMPLPGTPRFTKEEEEGSAPLRDESKSEVIENRDVSGKANLLVDFEEPDSPRKQVAAVNSNNRSMVIPRTSPRLGIANNNNNVNSKKKP
jgi:hypothetical protein